FPLFIIIVEIWCNRNTRGVVFFLWFCIFLAVSVPIVAADNADFEFLMFRGQRFVFSILPQYTISIILASCEFTIFIMIIVKIRIRARPTNHNKRTFGTYTLRT
ncbi:hypothetical protein PMAYCL1PPCAC_13872, partial [Pristionchus mayeri]